MLMHSGAYRVQHAACAACGAPLGWKFVRAAESAEKWKEGFLVLELARLDEAAFPLTPREEAFLAPPELSGERSGWLSGGTSGGASGARSGFGSVRSVRSVHFAEGEEGELGHRRSMSSLSGDRPRPHGPRQRRDS